MSLEKTHKGSLKSRNYINLHLTPNIKNGNTNNDKIQKANTNYNNNLAKNNYYINYSNNTKTITKKKSNLKSKYTNYTKTENNEEKINLINNPINTITSTRENTINSATLNSATLNSVNKKTKKHEPFFYEPSPSHSEIKSGSVKDISIKNYKKPENEDIRFLYKIFYNYNKNNKLSLNGQNNKNNHYNFNELRQYLIINEKNFKMEGNILLYQSTRKSGLVLDFFFIKKLESLIARFSLIIYIFLQCGKKDEARDIFLLMMKENKIYLDSIEKKIMEYYSLTNKKINIIKDYPRMTYEIIRIYSFIIKYSQYFNMMNYRNIFLGRYFELLYFIYNFFNQKGNIRMFNLEAKNQLIYWLSFALHNASYYSVSYYFPLTLPINLSNYIINLYQNVEDHYLTDSEKSLIVKTLYNLGLFYYLNDKKDEALLSLDRAQERISNIEEIDTIDNSFYQMNIKKKDSINVLVPKGKKGNNLFTKNDSRLSNRLSTNNSISQSKRNSKQIFTNNNDETLQKENGMNNNQNPNIIEQIIEGFNKKKNNLEDIKLLINYGVQNGFISEKNKPEKKYKYKYRKIFRGSHINLSTTFRVKDFLIPYYFNNPLLRKIELLMGEIELDKKNYNSAYNHILRTFFILISLKINRTCGDQKEFANEQKIIDKYLTLIEKYKDEEIKNNEKLMENNINLSSFNNSNIDTIQENYKEDLNDNIIDKYNLNSDDREEQNEDENQEILICGKTALDYKVLKEIEKFFVFLNSLSLFQIKLLNETQPDNVKRNDLPILFPSQFKDCLSNIQRIELDNLQTMALIRFIILKDPNKWITPNNLNIDIVNKQKLKEFEKKQKTKYQKESELNNTPIKLTKEYKYYQKIISSGKNNKEIREFLNMNFDLVLKILKKSSDEEIENIINFPYIIIEPVKNFKKKQKKKLKKKGYNITNYESGKYNYLLHNNNNYDYDYDNPFSPRINGRKRTYSSIKFKYNLKSSLNFAPDNFIKKNSERISQRNKIRNKSVYNKVAPQLKNTLEEEHINDQKDYNDSYEDYLISPDNSFEKK